MAKRKVTMKKIREIIRLHTECNMSIRQIAQSLTISRPVVTDYIQLIQRTGISYADISAMPDNELEHLVSSGNKKENQRYQRLSSQFEYFTRELKRTGVTLALLWEEYCAAEEAPYSYSQFCYHFQMYSETSELSMHIEHKAGDKMFVDFTGKKLTVTDRITGEIKPVEVFVAVLGASGYTYVEACLSQKKEDWIRVNENALRYFGGVSAAIVPDCLKSAITKTGRYEMDKNPEYTDFARHYDTTILPARPYSPKDKALAENAVKIVYTWIYARMRNEVFFTLNDLNKRIHNLLEAYNDKKMQRPSLSRRELFDTVEKEALRPLPQEYYEIKHFKRLKVQCNYHIYLSDDKHYYSVPYRYRGRKVDVFYTQKMVEVYENNIRIASHLRNHRPNGYTTEKDHMPHKHQYMAEWNPERFSSWAHSIGEPVQTLVDSILNSREHPEQAYKTCLGILNLSTQYSPHRLAKACARSLRYEIYTYKGVKNILENNMEEMEDYEYDNFCAPLPEHENVRGSNYYKRSVQ